MTVHDINGFFRHADEVESRLPGSGGPPTIDGMEARVAKLEAAVEHIQTDISDLKTEVRGLRSDARTDFRLLFGSVIALGVGLASLMAKGFHWL